MSKVNNGVLKRLEEERQLHWCVLIVHSPYQK